MKKFIYALILPLVVVGGIVFANREIKNENKNPTSKRISDAERKAALKKWEASPDGVKYKKWEASLAGKKVYASIAKIRKPIKAYTVMEATVTSLSLPTGSRLGFGLMVRIGDEDYILSFGPEDYEKDSLRPKNNFKYLRSLKVNDKIVIKSHNVSLAPKYSYAIISGDYVEHDNKIIYKRTPQKDRC